MLTHGYQHHALTRWLNNFPLRPQTLFTPHRSPASQISYWHRPHTSRTHLPILYIHGVGILCTYLSFFADLARASSTSDGHIGIIVLELLPLSFHIAHPALSAAEMTSQIHAILSRHSWSKVVLMANSYGTAIATQLLHSPLTAPLIGPLVLVDPVTFLLHLPDMTHNVTRRKPGRKASEHQLSYFASTDMGAVHTLARRFSWSENILWRDEECLRGRRVTVVLSGRDIIVDAGAVGRYLTRGRGVGAVDDKGRDEGWKGKEWAGRGMDVLWFEGLNHAEVFDTGAGRGVLVDVAMEYCGGGLGVGIEEGGALISRREGGWGKREW
jgi:pimeloyl-ACP methyl ester carboxylesterase